MKHKETIIVLDFGGGSAQVIARAIRDLGVYSEILPYTVDKETLQNRAPQGLIILDQNKVSARADESTSANQLENDTLVTQQAEIESVKARLTGLEMPMLELKVESTERATEYEQALQQFIFEQCGCTGQWSTQSYIDETIAAIRKTVGDRKVLCALSGGVDSSVVAVLIHRAIGNQLTCMFIDHNLLRQDEAESVMDTFTGQFDMQVAYINARERFMQHLAGVSDPEAKRKVIGEQFIRVFEEEAGKLGKFDFLAQGTLYSDVIESMSVTGQTVKSHHNVGGLPEDIDFELLEPLKLLFKDEVRKVGSACGLPDDIVQRQPFPGPGLAIRVLGEVTEEKLRIVRHSDAILREEIARAKLDIWQYFTVLPNMRSVGVKDGERTYSYTVGIRAVDSVDGMSARWARIPYDVLELISTRITTEVDQVNRVIYDITSKPPGTIEWE